MYTQKMRATQKSLGGITAFLIGVLVLSMLLARPVVAATMTFTITTGADDGRTQRNGATYPPDGTITSISNTSGVDITRSDNGGGKDTSVSVKNGLFRWDTSALPDNAVLSSATVTFNVDQILNDDARSLTADWYTSWPIDESDWILSAQTNALSGIALSTFSLGSNTITLENISTNVSTTGYTGVRFHINGGLPTGQNLLQVSSYEVAIIDPSTMPLLTVTYTTPIQTATTTSTTATANSTPHDSTVGLTSLVLKDGVFSQTRSGSAASGPTLTVPATAHQVFTLTTKPPDADQLHELYLKVNNQKFIFQDATVDPNNPHFTTTLNLPPGTYPYTLTADYGFTTLSQKGTIIVEPSTTDLLSHLNHFFRQVFNRESTQTEHTYWQTRLENKDKVSFPELIGAMQWQRLHAN